MNRAAFLDRDGVLNALATDSESGLPEAPLKVEDVALVPGAAAALAQLADAGFLLVGASNQPAAAKGRVSLEALEAVQARVLELLGAQGVAFAQFYVCWHHPAGRVDGLAGRCSCRKPAPGMLLEGIRELEVDPQRSWMIGDSESDALAARAAGVRSILVEYPPSAHRRPGRVEADVRVPDIGAAAAVAVSGRGYDASDG